MAQPYTHCTEIDLGRTKREIAHCFAQWPEAELVSIGAIIDQENDAALVTFNFQGNVCRVEYDRLCHHRCNMRALFKTFDGMRLMWKRGLGDLLSNTVAQMMALPGAKYIDPYELLGVRPDAPLEVAEASYRALSKSAHPDRGGSDERMSELNEAIEKIRTVKREEAA